MIRRWLVGLIREATNDALVRQVRVLRLEPDDVLLLKSPHRLSEYQVALLKAYWLDQIPDVAFKIIVLENGMDVDTLLHHGRGAGG